MGGFAGDAEDICEGDAKGKKGESGMAGGNVGSEDAIILIIQRLGKSLLIS